MSSLDKWIMVARFGAPNNFHDQTSSMISMAVLANNRNQSINNTDEYSWKLLVDVYYNLEMGQHGR